MNFYRPQKILSRNQPFNFILGGRGIGKSYSFKKIAIDNFIERGEQFVYVRRYDIDIQETAKDFFSQDITHLYPNHDFMYKKYTYYIDGMVAGYALPVNNFLRTKSMSREQVTMIIFDEFLNEMGKYIGGYEKPFTEPELCLNFYQSIARGYKAPMRDNVRFIFLANNVSVNNPYFTYFNIDKEIARGTRFIERDGYCVHIVSQNNEVQDAIDNSKFGKLIKGTKYGNYASGDDFYLDSDEFICEQPKGDYTYLFNIAHNGVVYGVLRYTKNGIYYITDKASKDYNLTISLTNDDHRINYVSIRLFKKKIQLLIDMYNIGCVRFKNQRCKQAFMILV